jgi:hypothetical protein
MNGQNKILTPDELRLLIKYWVVIISALLTYLLFWGVAKLAA